MHICFAKGIIDVVMIFDKHTNISKLENGL